MVKVLPNEVFAAKKHLFNVSLQQGVFPNKFKIGSVIPTFKDCDKCLLTSYRPISVLPCFPKLSKRIMCNKLYEFVIKNETLYEKQITFQAAHSAEHVILEVVNSISNSYGKFTLGTFIDFSKAFDTIDHTISFNKLNQNDVKK